MKKRLGLTAVLLVLTVLSGREFFRTLEDRQDLVYSEALSKEAVTVDGNELTLYDMAFYVAYQEMTVQKDAVIYNSEKPHKYWNAHTNGKFISLVAEQAVIDMAVHDEIFYQMAVAEELVLDEREEAYLANELADFCSDVTAEQLDRLGVTTEDIEIAMRKVALANKYQSILSQTKNMEYTEYDYTGSIYLAMLEQHEVVKNESVWSRITVGKITVNYK